MTDAVRAWEETVTFPTYSPPAPDLNPMFLEKRVNQGTSGRVYPYPFLDKLSSESAPKDYTAVYLENEYIRLMVLPEIGGRIHEALDKTSGYHFIYRRARDQTSPDPGYSAPGLPAGWSTTGPSTTVPRPSCRHST